MRNHKKFTVKQKERALNDWRDFKYSSDKVRKIAKKHKCCRQSLWLWLKLFRAGKSLQNKPQIPHTPHPKEQTDNEKQLIQTLLREHPDYGYLELYGELRTHFAYKRHFTTMYNYITKHCAIKPIAEYSKYIAKPYNTPIMIGQKMQMDVKYVPTACFRGQAKVDFETNNQRYYQYTMIDEASRERFIYPYSEHTAKATKDFIQRAVVYFGYKPDIIQTDNGAEFTSKYLKNGGVKLHLADEIMHNLNITHKLIRPATPRHNGKVERSHRTDQERFYNYLQFETYTELIEKIAEWLIRYNKSCTRSLRDKDGKQAWQSPNDKRAELLQLLKEQTESGTVTIVVNNKDGIPTRQTLTLPTPRFI